MGNVAAVMTPPPTNRMKFLRSIFTPPLKIRSDTGFLSDLKLLCAAKRIYTIANN